MTDAEQKAFTQGRAAGLEEAASLVEEWGLIQECADAIRAISSLPSEEAQGDARDAELDKERRSFEKWFSAKYHNRLSRNMPDGSYNDPVAYNFFIGWSARASLQQSAIQQLAMDKWVVVEQAVIELPGKRNQLGHTFFSNSELFNSSEEASEYIKKNDLPLGWVKAKVSHLFNSAALSSLEVIGKGEKG